MKNIKLPFNLIIWLAGLLGTAAAVIASFFWLDRPVALFAHYYFRTQHHDVVEGVSHFPNPLVVLAAVLSVVLGLRMILGRPFSWNQANTFVCSLSVLFTEATKNALKFIFGRTWPETWTHNNPSFIRDGEFGFHFMHGGAAYQSFPSGHMAALFTVISVLWIRYPRFQTALSRCRSALRCEPCRSKLSFCGRCGCGRFCRAFNRLDGNSYLGWVRGSGDRPQR